MRVEGFEGGNSLHVCKLQVWPTVYGGRLAAFHVGKRCKLMYSPNGLFSVDVGTETLTEEGRLRNKTVLLSPCGSLLTVSVPFPNLIRFVKSISARGLIWCLLFMLC